MSNIRKESLSPGKERVVCKKCGKEFVAYRAWTRSYCSKSQQKLRGRKNCSRKCAGKRQSELRSGSNSNWWRGGVSNKNRRIRYSAKMKEWRKAVFERDDYTCQFCNKRGGYLEADHIKQFAYYPKLRFDLDNGRTLCRPCHMGTPTWGNNGKA